MGERAFIFQGIKARRPEYATLERMKPRNLLERAKILDN
jgi:hypothetical protein